MREHILHLGIALVFFVAYAESVDEDKAPVTSAFHCSAKNGCCDQHEWCRFWQSVGECKENGAWMVDNCQLACDTCRSSRKPRPFQQARQPLTKPPRRRPHPTTPSPRRPPPPRRQPHPPPQRIRPPRPVPTRPPPARVVTQQRARPTPSEETVIPSSTMAPPNTTQKATLIVKVHRKRPNRLRNKGISHRLPKVPKQKPLTVISIAELTETFHTRPTTVAPTTPVTVTTTTTTEVPTTTVEETTTTTEPPTTTTTSTTTVSTTTATTTFTTPRTTTTTTTAAPTTPSTTERSTTEIVSSTEPLRVEETTTEETTTTMEERTTNEEERFRNRFTPAPQQQQQREQFNRQQFTRPPPPPTTRRPPPTRPTTTRPPPTTTTTTTMEAPPPPRPVTQARAPVGNREQRCQEILKDFSQAAEDMIKDKLVSASEDNSNRQTVDLDSVIRSNLANACVPRLDETSCEKNFCYNAYYRTMDGTCNNMDMPLRGASYRPYTRLLPTIYDNELSEPVGSLFPQLRPSPREVTRQLTSSHASVVSDEYNAMVMQFGQFISHDMAKTTLVPSAKCNVCQNITSRCMAVPITDDDTNMGFKKNTCVRVSRSSPICGSGNTKPRQQLNENTGYIDGSPIYGSSVHDSMKFRDGHTGFLKLPSFNGMQTLPFDQSKCKNKKSCSVIFTAGDSRVNLFVGLSAWHTVFTKEHNRIANQLKRMNPHWDGERLYQESRKIVGAQIQAIVFREWLPKVLGAAFASVVGDYRGYDPTVDSTIANEFTSAAFRFGHGMIQEFYQRLGPNFANTTFGALAFQKGTLHSDVLVNEGGPDPLLRGMFSQNVKRPQRVTTTVTENMFGSTDLSSINIQRGRDHGHPAYVKYRELCGMGVATSFEHLSREILNTVTRDKLQTVYGTVDRVDLWVGALMEDPVVRGLVGPTIACIVGPQFKRTRDGDRFYFENPGVFTRAQLSEIRKSSLSRIICDNSQTINMVPREAFRLGHLTPCQQIPQMDLTKWQE